MLQRNEMISVLLDAARDEGARLESIAMLRNELEDERVMAQIFEIAADDPSVKVRSALLSLIVELPITKISDKMAYTDVLYHFAVIENETDLRHLATRRLGELATDDQDLELLISEILINESDIEIRSCCMAALGKMRCQHPFLIHNLKKYAEHVDPECVDDFFSILSKLGNDDLASILFSLYSPFNSQGTKEKVISVFYTQSTIPAQSYKKLVAVLIRETNERLIAQLIQVFMTKAIKDTEIISYILDELGTNRYSAGLVKLTADLVASNPEAAEGLIKIFERAASAQLKLRILSIFEDANILDILISGALDRSPAIRSRAIAALTNKFDQAPEKITTILIDLLDRNAPYLIVRQVIDCLSMVQMFSPENERSFLTYFQSVNNPILLEQLAPLLAKIPVGDHNADTLLGVYLKMLDHSLYSQDLKHLILDQLINFNTADQVAIKACLEKLMCHETDIEELALIYDKYMDFRDNSAIEISMLLKLFLKFTHHHPHHLTQRWISEFRQLINANDEVKKISDYLIWLTRDKSLILKKGTDSVESSIIGAIKEALKNNRHDTAKSILDDAYENRSISKNEITHLFKWILEGHVARQSLLWPIVNLLTEAKLFPAPVTDAAIRYLEEFPDQFPDNDTCGAMMKLLVDAGEKDAEIKRSVAARLNQQSYEKFIDRKQFVRYGFYHDQDYRGFWWGTYTRWPFFDLFEGNENKLEFCLQILNTPVKPNIHEHLRIHYFCLMQLYHLPLDEEALKSLSKFIDRLEVDLMIGSMFDRACLVFYHAYKQYYVHHRYKVIPDDKLVRTQTDILIYQYLQYLDYAHRTTKFVCLPAKVDMSYLRESLGGWGQSFTKFMAPLKEHIKRENRLVAFKEPGPDNCPAMLNVEGLSDESIKAFVTSAYSLPQKDEDIEYILNFLEWKYDLDLNEFYNNSK